MLAFLLVAVLAQDPDTFDDADSANHHAERLGAAATRRPPRSDAEDLATLPNDPVAAVEQARDAVDAAVADRRRAQDALHAAQQDLDAARSRRLARVDDLGTAQTDDDRANLADRISQDTERIAELERAVLTAEAAVNDAGRDELAARASLDEALGELRDRLGQVDAPPPLEDGVIEDLEQDRPTRQALFEGTGPQVRGLVEDLTVDLGFYRSLTDLTPTAEQVAATLADALRARSSSDPALASFATHDRLAETRDTTLGVGVATVLGALRSSGAALWSRRAQEALRGFTGAELGPSSAPVLLRRLTELPGIDATTVRYETRSHRGTTVVLYNPVEDAYLALVATEPRQATLTTSASLAAQVNALQDRPSFQLVGGTVYLR